MQRIKETPPADLTVCPAPVEGFPEDQTARMPPDVRDAAIRVAEAFGATTERLRRLVEWHAPGACSETP